MPRSGSRVRVSFAALLTTMSRTNVLLSFSKESPWSRLSYTNARVFVSHSRKNVQAFFPTGSPTQNNRHCLQWRTNYFVVGKSRGTSRFQCHSVTSVRSRRRWRRSPGGGIGRRVRFRCVCREACRFESCSGHRVL